MSDKHPNPHHQQAPVHGSEEAQPGLDSLAPDDRSGAPRRNPPPLALNRPPLAA
jgi:catalase